MEELCLIPVRLPPVVRSTVSMCFSSGDILQNSEVCCAGDETPPAAMNVQHQDAVRCFCLRRIIWGIDRRATGDVAEHRWVVESSQGLNDRDCLLWYKKASG